MIRMNNHYSGNCGMDGRSNSTPTKLLANPLYPLNINPNVTGQIVPQSLCPIGLPGPLMGGNNLNLQSVANLTASSLNSFVYSPFGILSILTPPSRIILNFVVHFFQPTSNNVTHVPGLDRKFIEKRLDMGIIIF